MQRVIAHTFTVEGPVDRVFPLFDPRHEDEWAPNWRFQGLQPTPYRNEANAVFRIDNALGREIWVVLDLDAQAHRAEYLALRGEQLIRRVHVQCEARGDETVVHVRYHLSALDAAGQAQMGSFDDAYLRAWEAPIRAAARHRGATPA